MRIKILVLISFVVLSFGCNSNPNEYLIDFGKDLTAQKELVNSSELSLKSKISRNELNKIRNGHLLDGISDEKISVQLKLPIGKYKIISYLEAGLTDSSYLKLFSGNAPINYSWQYFAPPAEGRENIQKMYRSISLTANVKQDPLVLDFEGEKDRIRLLSVFTIPMDKSFDEVSSLLSEKLTEIGKLNSVITSTEIRNLIESNLLKENSSLNYYLKIRLEELALANDLFEMMGWEKGTQIYGLSIFDRLNQSVMLLDGLISDNWIDEYLGDRTRWLRGRLLWWLNKERGGEGELETAKRDLNYLLGKFPNNELLQMYTGKKIDTPDEYDSLKFADNAPEWSKLQHEALGRLLLETKWWVEERQAENGELGGKIGDDVELLRWWSAIAAYGDTTTIKGWKKLGDAVWSNPKVFKGYSTKPIDVEHSSEFISDTFPEMIYFNSANADKYLEPSADYFKNLWTFKNKFGRRFFKSAWFSSTEVKTDPPRNRDLAMNTRAVKAVRYLAWKTNDDELLNALFEWSDSWKVMALRDDKGKPVGLFPASVRGVDEQFNGDGKNWYDAGMFWDYFDWESGGSVQFYDQLLFSYISNKDESLLEPLKLTLDLIKKLGIKEGELIKGTKEWAVNEIATNYRFWNTVSQYRIFTKDKSYDNLIVNYGNPYSKYIITKDEKYLSIGLSNLLDDIRYNVPLRTTEVIHTDRVRIRDIITLKGMITGYDAYESDSPFSAVTYENTNSGLTMLVEDNTLDNLKIKIFSHSVKISNPIVKIWLLENGKYHSILREKSGKIISNSELEIIKRGQRIELKIPPKKEIIFSLIKKEI